MSLILATTNDHTEQAFHLLVMAAFPVDLLAGLALLELLIVSGGIFRKMLDNVLLADCHDMPITAHTIAKWLKLLCKTITLADFDKLFGGVSVPHEVPISHNATLKHAKITA